MGDWLAQHFMGTGTFTWINKKRVNLTLRCTVDSFAIRVKGDSEYGKDVRSGGMKMTPLLWRVVSVWLSVVVVFW